MLYDSPDATDDALELQSQVSALQRALEQVVLQPQSSPESGGDPTRASSRASVLFIRPQFLVVATHPSPSAATSSDDLHLACHRNAVPPTSVSDRDAESARIVYGALRSLAQQQLERYHSIARRTAGMPGVDKRHELTEPSALTVSLVCSGGVANTLPLAFGVLKNAVLEAQGQSASPLGALQLGSFPLRALSGIRVAASGAALLCMLSEPMVGVTAVLNAPGRSANPSVELRVATQPFFGFRARTFPAVRRGAAKSTSERQGAPRSSSGGHREGSSDDEYDVADDPRFPMAATAWYMNPALAHVLLMPSSTWLDLFPFALQDTALRASRQLHEWYVDLAFPLSVFPSRVAEWKAFAELVESCFVDRHAQYEFYRSLVVLVLFAELELVNDTHIRPSSPLGWQLLRLLIFLLDDVDDDSIGVVEMSVRVTTDLGEDHDALMKAGLWLEGLGTAPSPRNPRIRIVVRESEERYEALLQHVLESIRELLADVCGSHQGPVGSDVSRGTSTTDASPVLFDGVSRVAVVLTGVYRAVADPADEDAASRDPNRSATTRKPSPGVPAPHAFSAPALRGLHHGNGSGASTDHQKSATALMGSSSSPGSSLHGSSFGAALPYFAVNVAADLATAVTVRSFRNHQTSTAAVSGLRRAATPALEAPLRCSFELLQAALPDGRAASRTAANGRPSSSPSSSAPPPLLLLSALIALQNEGMERAVDTSKLRAAGVSVGRLAQRVPPLAMPYEAPHRNVVWIEDEEHRAPIEQEWRSRVDSHLCYAVAHAVNAEAGECWYDVAHGAPLRPTRVPVTLAVTAAKPMPDRSPRSRPDRKSRDSVRHAAALGGLGSRTVGGAVTLADALDHNVKAGLHSAIGVARSDPPAVRQWKEEDAALGARYWKLAQARERFLWRSVELLFEGVVVGQPILHGYAIPALFVVPALARTENPWSERRRRACHAALLPCIGATLLAFDALPRIVAAVPGDEFCAEFFPLVARSEIIRQLQVAYRERDHGPGAVRYGQDDEHLLSAVCEALGFPIRSYVIGRWPADEDQDLEEGVAWAPNTNVSDEDSKHGVGAARSSTICVLLTAAGVQWMEHVRASSDVLVAQRRVESEARPSSAAPTQEKPNVPAPSSLPPRGTATAHRGVSGSAAAVKSLSPKHASGSLPRPKTAPDDKRDLESRSSHARLGFTPHKRFVDSSTVQTLRTVEHDARFGKLSDEDQQQFRWHLDPMVVAERERAAKAKAASEKFLADPTQPPWRKAALSPMTQHVHLNRTAAKLIERHTRKPQPAAVVPAREGDAATQARVASQHPSQRQPATRVAIHPPTAERRTPVTSLASAAAFDVKELRSLITRHL